MYDLTLQGARIYTENQFIDDGFVAISDKKIAMIDKAGISNPIAAKTLTFPANWHIIPGMIDIHIHGGYGADAMDGEIKMLENISKNLASEGVTSFLATTMTMSTDRIERALSCIADYRKIQQHFSYAELLGVNLEGPFIAQKQACAQDAQNILLPDIDLFTHWQKIAENSIKIVTIAPDTAKSLEMIRYLKQNNVVISFGHSDADYDQGVLAILAGCNHVTHLFNAMRGIHHREPNAITAFLLDKDTDVEVIADGIHINHAVLKMIIALKGNNNIILISDAMRAKGMPNGIYELGGNQVIVKDKQARLKNGALAGSILHLDQALRNMINFTGSSLIDVLKMVTINPARKIGVFDRKGSIALNKDADFVVLNENLEVMLTVCKGEIAYERGQGAA